MSAPVRCLVADDHPALTVAVCDFLDEAGYAIVGPVADGVSAVALARAERPELAVVDYRMPELWGSDLVLALRAASPSTLVVVYTAEAGPEVVRGALAAGAGGVLLKEAPLADIARALVSVRAGRTYIDPGAGRVDGAGPVEPTPRELDVLNLVADGLTQAEIGVRLGIGAETVRTHVHKACKRLDAATTTQAVATALRLGLLH
jgi:DNA-binding NarL/FixJ family response regulator